MIILLPCFGAYNFFSLTPSSPLFAAVMLLCSDNETFSILDLYLHLLSGPFFSFLRFLALLSAIFLHVCCLSQGFLLNRAFWDYRRLKIHSELRSRGIVIGRRYHTSFCVSTCWQWNSTN